MKGFTIALVMLALAGCQSILGIEDVGLRKDGGVGVIDAGVIIDAAPPSSMIQATIVQKPPSLTNVQETTFTFTAPLGATGFECRLDDGAFTTCTSPHLFNAEEGARQFQVRALDVDGDGPPATHPWTVDITRPGTVITSMPPDPIVGDTVVFEFNSFPPEIGTSFECRLNQGSFSPCDSGDALVLGDGDFNFRVRAHDAAGNFDETPAAHAFEIAAGGPPDTILTGSPPTSTNSGDITFTFDSSKMGSTFECRVAPAGFSMCTSPHLVSVSDGSYHFEVRARDVIGPDPSPEEHDWVVDQTPPVVTISNQPDNPETLRSASFTFTSEPNSTFECNFDNQGFTTCLSPYDASDLETRAYTMRIRATDPAGNLGAPTNVNWNIGIIAFQSMEVNGALDSFVFPPEGSFVDAGADTSAGRQSANEACLHEQLFNGALAGLEISAVMCVDLGDSVALMSEAFSIPVDSPIIGLQKTTVAGNWPNLTGGNLTSSLGDAGVSGGSLNQVWMGCNSNGTTDQTNTCKSWAGSADNNFGAVGSTTAVDVTWLRDPTNPLASCMEFRPVFCVAY